MYEINPILKQYDINIPQCMYEMKNISLPANTCENESAVPAIENNFNEIYNLKNGKSTSASTASAVSRCCPLDLDRLDLQIRQLLKFTGEDIQNVAIRQEKVMQQLNNLKAQLAGIRSTLGLCSVKDSMHTATSSSTQNDKLTETPMHDVVINGHPNFIPYALLAVKNAWKKVFTLDVKTFMHSTMNDICKEAKVFENALKAIPIDPKLPKINIILIWKNCEHTEMISSPTMFVPIYGEINIIRYLGRVGPIEYRYEESPLCNEIDAVLDICYQLLRCTTSKTKSNIIRILNNRLQKKQYFGGNQMSIADIGVHSSLRRMHLNNDKDITPALSEWRKRVEKLTMI